MRCAKLFIIFALFSAWLAACAKHPVPAQDERKAEEARRHVEDQRRQTEDEQRRVEDERRRVEDERRRAEDELWHAEDELWHAEDESNRLAHISASDARPPAPTR